MTIGRVDSFDIYRDLPVALSHVRAGTAAATVSQTGNYVCTIFYGRNHGFKRSASPDVHSFKINKIIKKHTHTHLQRHNAFFFND